MPARSPTPDAAIDQAYRAIQEIGAVNLRGSWKRGFEDQVVVIYPADFAGVLGSNND